MRHSTALFSITPCTCMPDSVTQTVTACVTPGVFASQFASHWRGFASQLRHRIICVNNGLAKSVTQITSVTQLCIPILNPPNHLDGALYPAMRRGRLWWQCGQLYQSLPGAWLTASSIAELDVDTDSPQRGCQAAEGIA
jgi:hypothetical protein